MNLIFGVTRYVSFLVSGLCLLKWYVNKKGWESNSKSQVYFIITWKSIIAIIQVALDFLIEGSIFNIDGWIYLLLLLLIVFITFFFNIFLGYFLFKNLYKENKQEAVFIILIIVIAEYVIENLGLYLIFIPFSLS